MNINAIGYNNFVAFGKTLVKKLDNIKNHKVAHQSQIARYAIAICDIRHGGTTTEQYYTITEYARDIGLPQSTVSHWVCMYRDILLKIGISEPTRGEWTKSRKVLELLKREYINADITNPDQKRFDKKFKDSIPRKEVQGLFDGIVKDPFVFGVLDATNSAKQIRKLLIKSDLSVVQDKRLIELMNILNDSKEFINGYLVRSNSEQIKTGI